MKITNIFIKEKEQLINKLIASATDEQIKEIKDRVAYDFLRYLDRDKKMTSVQFETAIKAIKIVALANEHEHVSQSDLIALTLMLDKQFDDETFYKALGETMFKEINLYLDANGDFKDAITPDFSDGVKLSDEIIEHAAKLSKWTKAEQERLISTKDEIVKGPQITNKITGEAAADFYIKSIDHIISVLNWQSFAFNMVANQNQN